MISNLNQGTINASEFSFANVENLTGGSAGDEFQWAATGSVAGLVQGSGGIDTLNYLSINDPIVVNMATQTATRMNRFASIENVIGGSSSSDSFSGPVGTNAWSINGINSGIVRGVSFSGMETLHGNSGSDTFTLVTGNAAVTGQINGNSGTDTLIGFNQENVWQVTGAGSGSLNGTAFKTWKT